MSYTGFDVSTNNPIADEVIARGGGMSSDDLEAYGRVAGQVAGAAACAEGGPALASVCGWLGGKLGALIGKAIPIARGAGMAELVADTWNKYQLPRLRKAKTAQVAVLAYLTLRDRALSDAAAAVAGVVPRDEAIAWADRRLTELGALAADDVWQWAPDPIMAQQQAHAFALAEGREGPRNQEEQQIIAQGLDPRLYFFPEGPASSSSWPNWYRVGGGGCGSAGYVPGSCRKGPDPPGYLVGCVPLENPHCKSAGLTAEGSLATANAYASVLRSNDIVEATRAHFMPKFKLPGGGGRLTVKPAYDPKWAALRAHRVDVPIAERSWGRAAAGVAGAGVAVTLVALAARALS